MKAAEIKTLADQHVCAVHNLDQALADKSSKSKMVTSRGAIEIRALLRGRNYIGFAVWSCAKQGYVAGSWQYPLDWASAVAAEKRQPWAG